MDIFLLSVELYKFLTIPLPDPDLSQSAMTFTIL